MADYKELFYQSQALLADMEEELKGMLLLIRKEMQAMEEAIISEDVKNEQKTEQ